MKWRRAGKVDLMILEFAQKTKITTGRSDIVKKQLTQKMNAQLMVPKNTCNPDYGWCCWDESIRWGSFPMLFTHTFYLFQYYL